jgi:predicted enzyme related to lactoylglutathione lyase
MSNPIGALLWNDLTVENATEVKDFYTSVIGWTATEQAMGDYNDYNIHNATGEVIAGICHARGVNKNIPPQWLLYIKVKNVEESLKNCTSLGGTIIDGPRMMGKNNFAIIKDPAGAILAIIEDN